MNRVQRGFAIILLYSLIGLDFWMVRDYFDTQVAKISVKIDTIDEKSLSKSKNTPKIDKILKNIDILRLEPAFLAKKRFLEQVPWTVPLDSYYVSSHYGFRRDPITRRRSMHRGIDLAANKGTKVYSTLEGTVIFSGRNGRFGRMIKIKHKNGFTTIYGHLFRFYVKKGQHVVARQVIGLVGNSGRSTGYHLHYEIKHQNKYKNPYHFFVTGKFLTKG